MTEDRGAEPQPGAAAVAPGGPEPIASAGLEVTVVRTGGLAGIARRWMASIPDDGAPAARAARRIAALGAPAGPAPRTGRSEDAPEPPGPSRAGSARDRRVPRPGASPGRGRDRFQWTVSCGPGTVRCDEDSRRADPDLDRLIGEVTRRPVPGPG